jgi:translation initiation factor IF-1
MAVDELIIVQGTIVDVSSDFTFRVRLDESGHTILAKCSGRLRKNKIKMIVGDKVKCEMSKYDINRGRISERLNPDGSSR